MMGQKSAYLCRLQVAAHSQSSKQQHLKPGGPPCTCPYAQAGNAERYRLLAPAQLQCLPALLHRVDKGLSQGILSISCKAVL